MSWCRGSVSPTGEVVVSRPVVKGPTGPADSLRSPVDDRPGDHKIGSGTVPATVFPAQPADEVSEEGAVMKTLDVVPKKKAEPSAEETAAKELVRQAREQGLSLTGPDGLLKQFTKSVLETALNEEMTEHLGHEKHRAPEDRDSTNVRNGTRPKTVLTEATEQVEIEVPRDREGSFEPQIVKKRQRRLTEPGRRRCVLPGLRRPQGAAGGGRERVAVDDGAGLHHPSDPGHVPARLEAGLGPAEAGREADLRRPERAGGPGRAGRADRDLGGPLPGDHPTVGERWAEFIPFLDYDLEIRIVICSTNAIESLNARYRRAVRARGHFPTEQAAMKCLYLVTRSLDPTGKGQARWTMRWKPALNAFATTFAGRWPAAETY